jgi:hypothetical protein
MNIVGSSYFLRNLRNLDFFTLDFGKSKKDLKTDKFRKIDEFIVKYRSMYNRQIMKFGSISDKISFYEDLAMDDNEYVIFKGSDIYEITFDNNEIKNMQQYILGTLRKIEESEEKEVDIEEHNQKMVKDFAGNDVWIAEDDKNFGKKYVIDQRLSREDYRKQVKEKFKN